MLLHIYTIISQYSDSGRIPTYPIWQHLSHSTPPILGLGICMYPSRLDIEQISSIGSSLNPSECSQTACHQRQRGSLCGFGDGFLQKYRIYTRRSPISSRYISLLISAGRRKSGLCCWELFCRAPGLRGRCSSWIGSFHRLNISPLISQVESQIPIAFGEHSSSVNLGSFGAFFLRLKSVLKKWGAMAVESGGA